MLAWVEFGAETIMHVVWVGPAHEKWLQGKIFILYPSSIFTSLFSFCHFIVSECYLFT